MRVATVPMKVPSNGYVIRIAWKPFLLGPIFRALGMENSPFVLQKEKGIYVQQDIARLCRKYGLAPWVKPSVFPRLGVLPLRVALLSVDQPWIAKDAGHHGDFSDASPSESNRHGRERS
jgi:2-hydroxychromene-2-carboxylate isomerase